MIQAPDLPPWAAIIVAFLIFSSAAMTLIGLIGLLRLRTFYERVHAPTLGTSFGTLLICLASIVCFSVLRSRPSVHEILIVVFITLTAPVSFMLLGRAALIVTGSKATPKSRPNRNNRQTRPGSPPCIFGRTRTPGYGRLPWWFMIGSLAGKPHVGRW